MIDLCRDLVALVASVDRENGGSGRVPFPVLKGLAVRAAALLRPRDVMEIEIDAIEANFAARDFVGPLPEPNAS